MVNHLLEQFSHRPFFLNVIVHLSGVCTQSAMQRYINRFADAYAQVFTPHLFSPEDEDNPFVMIRSRSATLHRRYRSKSSSYWPKDITDQHEGGFSAELVVGRGGLWPGSAVDDFVSRRDHGLDAGQSIGFTAVISEILLYKGDVQSESVVWERFYAVNQAEIANGAGQR